MSKLKNGVFLHASKKDISCENSIKTCDKKTEMSTVIPDETADTSKIFFTDKEFLLQYHLTVGNVLDYFARSDFYDLTSINELLKMQNRPMDQLDKTDGISFRLNTVQQRGGITLYGESILDPKEAALILNPGFVVIDKVLRENGEDSLLAKYYIIDGCIFQAPDLYSILSVRMRAAMFHLQEALHEVKCVFDWKPESGFRKKIAADEEETLYTFHSKELVEMRNDLIDENKLQKSILDSLLSEMGIS